MINNNIFNKSKDLLKLVTFEYQNSKRIGALFDKFVIDLQQACKSMPSDMKSLLSLGTTEYNKIINVLESDNEKYRISLDSIKIKAPIENPDKVICIGLNFRDHAKEGNFQIPSEPVVFSKFVNSICGHNDFIVKPKETDQVDYEVELVIVIGKEAKNVSKEEALSYVAGYTVGNDISARDWQLHKPAGQWLLGKSFDTFAPIGPSITINPLQIDSQRDIVSLDPNHLNLKCILNGETLQNGNTKEFVFNSQELISYISRVITLKPGDIIFTGTPAGVGFTRNPPLYLKPGDHVVCEIENLGKLENYVK
ncbi:Fumarylacetoacetate (FAA) hydrolase domain-containing protein [Tieghemostelium lacteum]|uniref:Fumarylacetoacetate (FAA) hydrolase domain-containing protein n=1 Tax=Tieghemostelium lacteum TaxID=361077 RepID=A0A152A277_TIELA|nr:Fumarylacetoacetate (FAA) hydrolase domain-containing protein [Tieghemostelium lacteum]|eukprot:KYR00362.1 Fumarylacetoacetate (FAA) hydrolase domain-containing protein [Tieghemostelium lacteum]